MSAGERSLTHTVATCLLRLHNKLIKVCITAKHFGNTSHFHKDTDKDTGKNNSKFDDGKPACKSSATARLAHFLADLNPDGVGSFDTTCLVTHDWKPLCSQQEYVSASAHSIHSQLQHNSVLQAVLQQSPGCTAKQLKSPWLAPVVAVFNSPHSQSPQQLCLLHRSQHSLADALRFSPGALHDDALCRLILFQILSCLQSLHSQGLYLGHLSPDTIWLTADRSAPVVAAQHPA